MCFNLVRGDLSVGGDNDNFICIALFHKQSLQTAGRGGKGHRLKVRRVKKTTVVRNKDKDFMLQQAAIIFKGMH